MTQSTLTERPDDCRCWGQTRLPCWPCYRAGFEAPNPQAPKEADQ